MYNTSLRIVNDIYEAEDIMQEAFLKAFQSLNTFKAEVNFGAWLRKIVVNLSLDSLRKHKPTFETLLEQEDQYTEESEENEDDKDYRIEEIKSEINKLPDGYRIVLSLYLLEGYDHEEIADIMNISPSTSRSQYARSRKKLVENLKKIEQ